MPWIFNENSPIYLQIIEHIKLKIALGEYKSGDKLIAVRELAAEAEVNPNTMQKALSELEREGLVFSQRTAGRYITNDQNLINNLRDSLANEHNRYFLEKMRILGYPPKEALTKLESYIKEDL